MPGTPLQNRLEELWSLLNLLMPHVFSSDQEFQAWFESSDSTGKASPSPPCGQLTEEENLLVAGRFHQILAPFMLRRLKAQVLADLPAKVHAALTSGRGRCACVAWPLPTCGATCRAGGELVVMNAGASAQAWP